MHQLVDHEPVRLAPDHDPGVEQPDDQLLHVERVAVGCLDHELDQVGGQVLHVVQQLMDQLPRLPLEIEHFPMREPLE